MSIFSRSFLIPWISSPKIFIAWIASFNVCWVSLSSFPAIGLVAGLLVGLTGCCFTTLAYDSLLPVLGLVTTLVGLVGIGAPAGLNLWYSCPNFFHCLSVVEISELA